MFVGCAPAILRPSGLLSALRPQDVFATSLYTGTGGRSTITNGIDLLGKGGLVWTKNRSSAVDSLLIDSARGTGQALVSNTTAAESGGYQNNFLSNGYNTFPGQDPQQTAAANYVSWSFRRAAKFFDIVTYTGDGTSGRVIPHALGIKPGMIIVKRRDAAADWSVYHSSNTAGKALFLNTTAAVTTNDSYFIAEPTASGFIVGDNVRVNAAGATCVAYLFAHDPDTTNGIVQCGSFTTDANGAASVTLGYPVQYVLAKKTSGSGDWAILDTARGWGAGADKFLLANTSAAEGSADLGGPTATGFTIAGFDASGTYAFMAIRAPIA